MRQTVVDLPRAVKPRIKANGGDDQWDKAEGARPCSNDGPTPHARGRRMRDRGLGRLV